MDNFIRKQHTTLETELEFQILSWEAFDEQDEYSDEEDPITKYNIYTFGVNKNGESVCVRFEDYQPYLFALIPEHLQKTFDEYKKKELEKYIKNKLYRNRDDLELVSIVERKKYKGFTNCKQYKFIKFVCKNLSTFNKIKYILNPKNKQALPKILSIDINQLKFDLYESNIEPFLRFTHKMDIKMAGWVRVKNTIKNNNISRCQHSYTTKYNQVSPLDFQEVSNLTLDSWDI
jgi:hypothetical protein